MNDKNNDGRVDSEEFAEATASDLSPDTEIEGPVRKRFDSYLQAAGIKKRWLRDTAFGRTLSLRNKTGKVVLTGLAGVGSTFLPGPVGGWIRQGVDALITIQTGVPMEIFDMSLLQIGIMTAAFIIAWALPSIFPAIREKAVWKTIEGRLDDVADEVVSAVDKDSEGGKGITRNEWKAIIGSAIKKKGDQNG